MAPEGTGYLGLEPYDVYWGRVRDMYTPFENGMKSGTARVFDHQIPGELLYCTWYATPVKTPFSLAHTPCDTLMVDTPYDTLMVHTP